MKNRIFLKLLAVLMLMSAVGQSASATTCACYGRKYFRYGGRLTYRDDFIGNVSPERRYDCDTLAGRFGYDAFYLYCGY